MDRSYASGAAGSAPAAPASPSIGYPTAGNPVTGTPATKPGPYWYHQITEELMAIITAAGITPAQGTLTQLASAIQSGKLFSSAAGGTADALTASFVPAVASLVNGMTLYVRAGSANATTTPTFTPASGTIAAKTIVKGNGIALAAGDVAGGGHWIELQYDSTLDKWVLLNPATGMATVTATNDASFADNSVKPASTSWVRGAMSAIATAAGFVVSFGSSGFIKFPSWLGSFIFQWMPWSNGITGSVPQTVTVPLPVAFPTNHYATVGCVTNSSANTASIWTYIGQSLTLSNYGVTVVPSGSVNTTVTGYAFSVGK